MHVKQATCRIAFLQGFHVLKSDRSIRKQTHKMETDSKLSPAGHFQIKKSISSLQQVSLYPCLRISEDYFKTEYGEARETK